MEGQGSYCIAGNFHGYSFYFGVSRTAIDHALPCHATLPSLHVKKFSKKSTWLLTSFGKAKNHIADLHFGLCSYAHWYSIVIVLRTQQLTTPLCVMPLCWVFMSGNYPCRLGSLSPLFQQSWSPPWSWNNGRGPTECSKVHSLKFSFSPFLFWCSRACLQKICTMWKFPAIWYGSCSSNYRIIATQVISLF